MANSRDAKKIASFSPSVQMALTDYTFVKDIGNKGQIHTVSLQSKNQKAGAAPVANPLERYVFSKPDVSLIAEREVFAQEVYRSLYATNPKGRIAVAAGGQTLVISKAVPGFKTLYELMLEPPLGLGKGQVIDNINNGVYKGFGNIIVLALLTGENDLHTNNIGVDENNHFVKIDGDWSSARLRYKEGGHADKGFRKFQITTEVLDSLPQIDLTYFLPYNWFDQVANGAAQISDDFLAKLKPANIQHEIQESILRTLLMPDEYFLKIAQRQALNQHEVLSNHLEMMNSRQQLIISAFGSQKFLDFMQSPAAKQCYEKFQQELTGYNLPGKLPLDNVDALKKMLSDRYEHLQEMISNSENPDKFVALYQALIDIDVDLVNRHGETPLMLAAEYGASLYVTMLLQNASVTKNVNAQNNQGETALMIAIKSGFADVVTELLKVPGIDISIKNKSGENAFELALQSKSPDLMISMIHPGLSIDTPINANNDTFLHYAVKENLPDLAKYCVENKADLNRSNLQGLTPLMLAVDKKDADLVTLLTDHHVDMDKESMMPGETALVRAVNARNHEMLLLLLDKGALLLSMNKCFENLYDSLVYLKKAGRFDLMLPLLISNLDLDLSGSDKKITLLHLAAESAEAKVIISAVQEGAKINETDSNGFTPIMKAAKNGHWETVLDLLKAIPDIDINACSRVKKVTVLSMAIESGEVEVVAKLLKQGANVHHVLKGNISMSDLATLTEDPEMIRLIRKQLSPAVSPGFSKKGLFSNNSPIKNKDSLDDKDTIKKDPERGPHV